MSLLPRIFFDDSLDTKIPTIKYIYFSYLYLLEGYLEGERFVVIRIKSALLDRRLLLFQPLAVLH